MHAAEIFVALLALAALGYLFYIKFKKPVDSGHNGGGDRRPSSNNF